MRLTPTPTALAIPAMPTIQSLPTMSIAATGASGAETLIYYTLSQPPPASPSLPSSGALPATAIPQISPSIRQNVTPTVSPGVPPVSPGLSPPGLVPDIMHLINYGDKDMGLLLSQRYSEHLDTYTTTPICHLYLFQYALIY